MPDLDTCRMPRETLLGLINSTSKNERITAPIPIPTLTELLGDDAPRGSDPAVAPEPQVVVRFTPKPGITPVATPIVERSHWIIALSATATLLIGLAVIFLA
jgi:hypothetical protein